MHKSLAVEEMNLIEPLNGNFKSAKELSWQELEQRLQHLQSKLKQMEALLLVIETNVDELKEPMTVILGLSGLLLAEGDDPNSQLATDLRTLVTQIRRMNEMIKGINQLTRYHPRLEAEQSFEPAHK